MIRFNSEITLDNGATAKHFVVGMMSIIDKKINIIIDAFTSKEIADTSLSKYDLLKQQSEKVKEFQDLLAAGGESEEAESYKLDDIQKEVNDLADKIQAITDYSEVSIDTKTIVVDYSEDLSEDFIKEQIKASEYFKDKEVEFI